MVPVWLSVMSSSHALPDCVRHVQSGCRNLLTEKDRQAGYMMHMACIQSVHMRVYKQAHAAPCSHHHQKTTHVHRHAITICIRQQSPHTLVCKQPASCCSVMTCCSCHRAGGRLLDNLHHCVAHQKAYKHANTGRAARAARLSSTLPSCCASTTGKVSTAVAILHSYGTAYPLLIERPGCHD